MEEGSRQEATPTENGVITSSEPQSETTPTGRPRLLDMKGPLLQAQGRSVCEDRELLQTIMASLSEAERKLRAGGWKSNLVDAVKTLGSKKNVDAMIARDFPFYTILAYRIHSNPEIYQQDTFPKFVGAYCEKFRALQPSAIADTMIAFLKKGDFEVASLSPEGGRTTALKLLEDACVAFAKNPTAGEQKKPQRVIFGIMAWISVALKCHSSSKKGGVSKAVGSMWKLHFIERQKSLQLTKEVVEEVKQGLALGPLLRLPPQLNFCPEWLGPLFMGRDTIQKFSKLRDLVVAVESHFSLEEEFVASFLVVMRGTYQPLLEQPSPEKLKRICSEGTPLSAIREALGYLDAVHRVAEQQKWVGKTRYSTHCMKWLSLLASLVDITRDSAHDCLSELTTPELRLVASFSTHITTELVEVSRKKLLTLPVHKFFSLYQSFDIWGTHDVAGYFKTYELPASIDLTVPLWGDLFRLVQSRARPGESLRFLLDFLKAAAERYLNQVRAREYVTSLLSLNTPWLFSGLPGRQVGKSGPTPNPLRGEFDSFLQQYIQRNSLNNTLLEQIEQIWASCSDERNEFQELVLSVLAKELIPDITVIQDPVEQPLQFILSHALSTTCSDVGSLQLQTARQKFCWGLLAACCKTMPLDLDNLAWVEQYCTVATQLGQVYQKYITTTKSPGSDEKILTELSDAGHVSSPDIASYFQWVREVRRILSSWKERFLLLSIKHREIAMYREHWDPLNKVGEALCAGSLVVNRRDVESVEDQFLREFEQLNLALVRYTSATDSKWCDLMSLLSRYGVTFSPRLQAAITESVALPNEEKYTSDHYEAHPPSITGKFKPSEDIALKLSKHTSLQRLSTTVLAIEHFTEPLCNHIDMLVFFTLQESQMFARYLHLFLKKENTSGREFLSSYKDSAFDFDVFAPSVGTELDDTPTQELILLQQALRRTRMLIRKLGNGTATYQEATAENTLDLRIVKIDRELDILQRYLELIASESPELDAQVQSFQGSNWVKYMLELFEISKHIRNIEAVIKKFNLTGCNNDPNLQQLMLMAETLDSEVSRSELTLSEANYKMEIVKQCLCLDENTDYSFLDLFPVMADSMAFFSFLTSRKFTGPDGRHRFHAECELITSQLQHGDYNEIVLNHLISAYDYVTPFMDQEQNLQSLMLRVCAMDAGKGCKMLETVNRNIDLIKLWFSKAEGDTVENVLRELGSVLRTGRYRFILQSTPTGSECCLELEYLFSPSHSHPPPSSKESVTLAEFEVPMGTEETVPEITIETTASVQHATGGEGEGRWVVWRSEQITDFVRKLGFLDAEKEGGREIKHFQKLYEVALRLADLYVRLKKLGHMDYLQDTVVKFLACTTTTYDANKEESSTRHALEECSLMVAELHRRYEWLMFFSVAKVIGLHRMLQPDSPLEEGLVEEIGLLLINTPEARGVLRVAIERALYDKKYLAGTDSTPMHVVGRFLAELFTDPALEEFSVGRHYTRGHTVPHQPGCCWGLLDTQESIVLHHSPWQTTFSQKHLVMLVISLYNGAPEAFQIFHCNPTTTEEELHFFFKRVAKYPLPYLILEINALPFHLQELFLQLYQEYKHEPEGGKRATLHLVESAPSVLREMPWIMKQEHKDTYLKIGKEDVRMKLQKGVLHPRNITCVELVYGVPGAGKSHQIALEVRKKNPHSVKIAVNEAFTLKTAISHLRSLPKESNCAIIFNFTMIPPHESMDMAQRDQYLYCLEIVRWFFFSLLILGYVEDPSTGLSFKVPSGLAWKIYVEVPSRNVDRPQSNLEEFKKELPVLGILGGPHFIHRGNPFTIDGDIRLVCGYLKAYQEGKEFTMQGSDHMPELEDYECSRLMKDFLPESIQGVTKELKVKENKTAQRLFLKYLKRRCAILDGVPKSRKGMCRFLWKRSGESGYRETEERGLEVFRMMLEEVCDISQWSVPRKEEEGKRWAPNAIKQLIYGERGGVPIFELLELDEDEYMKQLSLGSSQDTFFHGYLSHALGVPLRGGRLAAIDKTGYLLTLDYTIKMLQIHERSECGVPVIIEGETGVGKTALVEMLSKLWNFALDTQWEEKRKSLLELLRNKLGAATVDRLLKSENRSLMKEELMGIVNNEDDGDAERTGEIQSEVKKFLQGIKGDSVLAFLSLGEGEVEEEVEATLQVLWDVDSPEAIVDLLCGLLRAKLHKTFYKLNVHSALQPVDILDFFRPIFATARKLQKAAHAQSTKLLGMPRITVFLDEVNTSSCLGLFKEIIVDRTINGEPVPDNVFIIAACNPHRANSLATLDDQTSITVSLQETWVRGSYYVQKLPPTLRFLIWDYKSLDSTQEREYIRAKLVQLNELARNPQSGIAVMGAEKVNRLTHLIAVSHDIMRAFARDHFIDCELTASEAEVRSHSFVSQRDIQRLFNFYQWLMEVYKEFSPHGEGDYSHRAVLVALGIVYYLRLNAEYRAKYQEYLDASLQGGNQLRFSQAFEEELNWYLNQVELPPGIARTQSLKENLFAVIACTMTRTPLIIVGPPGCSKTLSFHIALANLKGEGSKAEVFRNKVFHSLDPHFYQCSRRTSSFEVETVFKHAINRQNIVGLPIYCVVFMDEAGLPEEKHESLKVLHQYLDTHEVSFVGITNRALDAAKSNRAVTLFRPEASDQDLDTLAKGCFSSMQDGLPDELQKTYLDQIVRFCPAYTYCMRRAEFQHFFGLRDFIHFIRYLRRKRALGITPQVTQQALERNFNGSQDFDILFREFLQRVDSSMKDVKSRNILEVLKESLEDCPLSYNVESEVRYKIIIDPSEDDSLVRLLFTFRVLDRTSTRMLCCSSFKGNTRADQVNAIAAILHSVAEGHTVLLYQTDEIHESFYNLFNQNFRCIDDPDRGPRYFTNVAIGPHTKPCLVHPNFQCVVVIKQSDVQRMPPPFLNRFEKYLISHKNLLGNRVAALPPLLQIVLKAAHEKADSFLEHIHRSSSIYGLKRETLDSLLLSLLPPWDHTYEPLKKFEVSGEKSVDIRVTLLDNLITVLRKNAGFFIIPVSADELLDDAIGVFDLVVTDPKFAGCLAGLTHAVIATCIVEAMNVLHYIPPSGGPAPVAVSNGAALVLTVLQQWLIRLLLKSLMQLMTPEALALHQLKMPASYRRHFLVHQDHFSLRDLLSKCYSNLQSVSGCSPNKLLCYTRSSGLIHDLPLLYPKSEPAHTKVPEMGVSEVLTPEDEVVKQHVFKSQKQVNVFKLLAIHSQSNVRDAIDKFIANKSQQVMLIPVNMSEMSGKVVNELRIMIEEAENIHSVFGKLFVLLLHFPPAMFTDACYPALFLQGWGHYYLDTLTIDTAKGGVDIRDWFQQCCMESLPLGAAGTDTLSEFLPTMLEQHVPVLALRVSFGSLESSPFNKPMPQSERTQKLHSLLVGKDLGKLLQALFQRYWDQPTMAKYLQRAAGFTRNGESTLNMTDCLQEMLKSSFLDFLLYMLCRMNENFNLDVLFDPQCPPSVMDLFCGIIDEMHTPKISELKVAYNSIREQTTQKKAGRHAPKFPFFAMISELVEKAVEQSREEVNQQLDVLDESRASVRNDKKVKDLLEKTVVSKLDDLQDEHMNCFKRAMEAISGSDELWERYFIDFTHQKLHMEYVEDGVSYPLVKAAFDTYMHQSTDTIHRVVALHVYFHVHQLELAKVAILLRSLNKIKQMALKVPQSPSSKAIDAAFITAAGSKRKIVGEAADLTIFITNTLFATLMGICTAENHVEEFLLQWYQTYNGVMSLPAVKKFIYTDLPQMPEVEAKLNVMHATYTVLHLSPSEREMRTKARQLSCSLFSVHFSRQSEKLKDKCPHLPEVVSTTLAVLTSSADFYNLEYSDQITFIMEQLLAHFFSEYRSTWHKEDIKWFLETANQQVQWKTCFTEGRLSPEVSSILSSSETSIRISPRSTPSPKPSLKSGRKVHSTHHSPRHSPRHSPKPSPYHWGPTPQERPSSPQECLSMAVFRFFLSRLLLANSVIKPGIHPPRNYDPKVHALVREVLLKDCSGTHGPYVPVFYQNPLTAEEVKAAMNELMQQPLAHLYFTVVLEHLMEQDYSLPGLLEISDKLGQQYRNPENDVAKKVLFSIEKQAVLQLILKVMAQHIDPKNSEKLAVLSGCTQSIKRLLLDERVRGGMAESHGMILGLQLLKHLRSFSSFTRIVTVEYYDLCEELELLGCFHSPLKKEQPVIPHLFPFMSEEGAGEELHEFYQQVRKALKRAHSSNGKKMDQIKHIVQECRRDQKKQQQFQMMLWLCAYYEFFNKKKSSPGVAHKFTVLLDMKERPLTMLQCLLDPSLMQKSGEHPDPLRQLFSQEQLDDSQLELRHALANLVGVILGSPPETSHLWFLLLDPQRLAGACIPGFMSNSHIDPARGASFDSGVELTPSGVYSHDDYAKFAMKGIFTLHSLYIMLWANFGALCVALLMLPNADDEIQDVLLSSKLPPRQYCTSQLIALWEHMSTNFGISVEDRCLLVTNALRKFYELSTDFLGGPSRECFVEAMQSRVNQDVHETLWHRRIFVPAWTETLQQHTQVFRNDVFSNLRYLDACYLHFPSTRELVQNVLALPDFSRHRLLVHILLQQPLLQAARLLLSPLIEFYRWLHTDLAYLVTQEQAHKMLIGSVVAEASKHYYSTAARKDLTALYKQLKEAYEEYYRVMGGAGSLDSCAVTQKSSKIFTITDETPLLDLLSTVGDPGRLYSMIASIIMCHNDTIDLLGQVSNLRPYIRLARYLPPEGSSVLPTEFKQHTSIMGATTITENDSDFRQLVRRRYNQYTPASSETQSHFCGSDSILEIPKAPKFDLDMIQEDVAAIFVAGKPRVHDPSMLLRNFSFRRERSQVTQQAIDQDPSNLAQDLGSIDERLPPEFKDTLDEGLLSQLEFSFHALTYHLLHEVASGLSAAIELLIRAIADQQRHTELLSQNVAQLLITEYKLKSNPAILHQVGIKSITTSQMKLLMAMGLPFLFDTLRQFVHWIQVGMYDFHPLPFTLKSHIIPEDIMALRQICDRYDGSIPDLVSEINSLMVNLNHMEPHFIKMIVRDTEEPIKQYLKEKRCISVWDKLPLLIPDTVCIRHYVPFRIELRRLMDDARKQVSTPELDLATWNEVAPDILKTLLQEMPTEQPEPELQVMREPPRWPQETVMPQKRAIEELEQPVNEEQPQEEQKEEPSEDAAKGAAPEIQEPQVSKNWEPELKQQAGKYTPDDVVKFLGDAGLEQYAEAFEENEISGDSLLDEEELKEVLPELGVNKAVHSLKILAGFKRKLLLELQAPPPFNPDKVQGKDPLAEFLKKHNMPSEYEEAFIREDIDWELLLYVGDEPLKELLQETLQKALGEIGIKSGLHKRFFKKVFKTFVQEHYM